MTQPIRRIGSSPGIWLSRIMLEQAGISTAVDVEVADGVLILRPAKTHPRDGWQERLVNALDAGDAPNEDLFAGAANAFDEEE